MPNTILRRRGSKRLGFIVAGLAFIWGQSLAAQTAELGVLKGKITNPSGAPIANAKFAVTNLNTNQTRSAITAADGSYELDSLPPGNYRLEVDAGGFQTLAVSSAAVTAGTTVLDEQLLPAPPAGPQVAPENLPNAPSSTEPSLSDLGITPQQTKRPGTSLAR